MPGAGLAYPGITSHPDAEVAELVDALASGASGGIPVEVRVLFSAPNVQYFQRFSRVCLKSHAIGKKPPFSLLGTMISVFMRVCGALIGTLVLLGTGVV